MEEVARQRRRNTLKKATKINQHSKSQKRLQEKKNTEVITFFKNQATDNYGDDDEESELVLLGRAASHANKLVGND